MANPLQTANSQIQAKCVELGDKAAVTVLFSQMVPSQRSISKMIQLDDNYTKT